MLNQIICLNLLISYLYHAMYNHYIILIVVSMLSGELEEGNSELVQCNTPYLKRTRMTDSTEAASTTDWVHPWLVCGTMECRCHTPSYP